MFDWNMIAEYFSTPLSKTSISGNGILIEEDGTYLSIVQHSPTTFIAFNGIRTSHLRASVNVTFTEVESEWDLIDLLREELEILDEKLQDKIRKAVEICD